MNNLVLSRRSVAEMLSRDVTKHSSRAGNGMTDLRSSAIQQQSQFRMYQLVGQKHLRYPR